MGGKLGAHMDPQPKKVAPGSSRCSPLYFAGHLDWAADIAGLQAEVGVKVLIRGNGRGVGRAGCLLHRGLGHQKGISAWPVCLGIPPATPQSGLTPLWEECCWAMPRKDWKGVLPPKEKGTLVSIFFLGGVFLWPVPPTLSAPRQGRWKQEVSPTPGREWAAGRRTWVYLCSSTCLGQRGAPCVCVSPAPRWWHCRPGGRGKRGSHAEKGAKGAPQWKRRA